MSLEEIAKKIAKEIVMDQLDIHDEMIRREVQDYLNSIQIKHEKYYQRCYPCQDHEDELCSDFWIFGKGKNNCRCCNFPLPNNHTEQEENVKNISKPTFGDYLEQELKRTKNSEFMKKGSAHSIFVDGYKEGIIQAYKKMIDEYKRRNDL